MGTTVLPDQRVAQKRGASAISPRAGVGISKRLSPPAKLRSVGIRRLLSIQQLLTGQPAGTKKSCSRLGDLIWLECGWEFRCGYRFCCEGFAAAPPRPEPPEMDDAFRVCTVESLLTDAECGGGRFILYRGATYEDQINDMYSFVPCRLADSEERRFCRPAITLPAGYLNPSSTQSPSNAGIPRSVSEVRAQWESVRKQVLDARCLLGVSFSTPRLDDGRIGPQAR